MTTSWDDGHVLDERLASVLARYGLAGTFYIAPRNREIPLDERLDGAAIRRLAQRFEIGGHTLTHPRLPRLDAATARMEISAGKANLEDTIGGEVASFCYPGGRHRPEHVAMVRQAGFRLARTVRRFETRPGGDPLRMPTTAHAYQHRLDARAAWRFAGARPLRALALFRRWDELAIAIFDATLRRGGVYHLWGHSWEIERYDQWAALDRVFRHISRRPGVRYVTNRDLLAVEGGGHDA